MTKRRSISDGTLKPVGYWKEFSHVEAALKPIIEQLSHFPSERELELAGRGDVVSAMTKHHSGALAVRVRMGYIYGRKTPGHWRDFNNVKSALDTITTRLGHFPTHGELTASGGVSLVAAIQKYHDGYCAVRQKLGHTLVKMPHGHWKDRATVMAELRSVEAEIGSFPTQEQLVQRGYAGLVSAICDYHGGLSQIKQELGVKEGQKPRNYWTFDRTITLCSELVREQGRFPTQKELDKLDGRYRGLSGAVAKYGGANKIRQAMNLPQHRRKYWNKNTVLEEARNIITEVGYLPTHRQLKELGRNDLSSAITKHSSLDELIAELKLTPEQVAAHPITEEMILTECRGIIAEYGDLPSSDELKKKGHVALASNIHFKGGFPYFRKRLGLTEKIKRQGYWKQWENIRSELQRLIGLIGHYPSQEEMVQHGRKAMPTSMAKYHGGSAECKKRFYEEAGLPTDSENLERLFHCYLGKSQDKLDQMLKGYLNRTKPGG